MPRPRLADARAQATDAATGRPGPGNRPDDANPRLTSDRLNDLADDFASGELVLDDAFLQAKFDAAATRIDSRPGRPNAERTVDITDDLITVTVSGERGTGTKTIALDLDTDSIIATHSGTGAGGASVRHERVLSYDADGFTSAVTVTNKSGLAQSWSLDFDLDDRLLTVTDTDGDVTVIAFDDVDAAMDGGFAALVGITPPTSAATTIA